MKQALFAAVLFMMFSCGSDPEEKAGPKDDITEETETELNKVQEDNIEMEEIDGELDSLINELE